MDIFPRGFPNMRAQAHLYGAHFGTVSRPWSCPRHIHPTMLEINWVLAGRQCAVVDGTAYVQQPGDVLLVPPMAVHEYRLAHGDSLSYFVLHLESDDESFMRAARNARELLVPADSALHLRLAPLLRRLAGALGEEVAGRTVVFAALYAVMAELESFLAAHPRDGLAEPAANEALARRIAREIESAVYVSPQRTPEPESALIAGIARTVGVSERHCNRVFRKLYRMPPRGYLTLLRLQEGMRRLIHEREPIASIAAALGYQNAFSFSRQFKKQVGLTPAEFRRERRDETFYLTPLNRLADSRTEQSGQNES
ncbi:MAG: AraC family transcriptional regulator [Paenibacillaceae bacterium]|nr:AraC family transcriptional regulator [Paenibacillaceae bacterium]